MPPRRPRERAEALFRADGARNETRPPRAIPPEQNREYAGPSDVARSDRRAGVLFDGTAVRRASKRDGGDEVPPGASVLAGVVTGQ